MPEQRASKKPLDQHRLTSMWPQQFITLWLMLWSGARDWICLSPADLILSSQTSSGDSRMCWTLELEPELGKAETGVCVYGQGEDGSVPAKRQAGSVTRPEGRLSEVKHGEISRASGRGYVNTAAALHICQHSMWIAFPSTAFSCEPLLLFFTTA